MSSDVAFVTAFEGKRLQVHLYDGQHWITANDAARALGYARPDALNQLYVRNADEFDSTMTCTLRLRVQGQVRSVRAFNRRGAMLLALLARTEKGSMFRRWCVEHLTKTSPMTTDQGAHDLVLQLHDHCVRVPGHVLDHYQRCERELIRTQRQCIRLQGRLLYARPAPAAAPAPSSQGELFARGAA